MKHHKEPDKPQPAVLNNFDIDFIGKILSIQAEDRIDTVRRMQEELDRQFCYNTHFTEEDRHLIMSIVETVAIKLTESACCGKANRARCCGGFPRDCENCCKNETPERT